MSYAKLSSLTQLLPLRSCFIRIISRHRSSPKKHDVRSRPCAFTVECARSPNGIEVMMTGEIFFSSIEKQQLSFFRRKHKASSSDKKGHRCRYTRHLATNVRHGQRVSFFHSNMSRTRQQVKDGPQDQPSRRRTKEKKA